MDKRIFTAANLSMHNKSHIKRSKKCGCYYCMNIFSPDEIKEWVDPKNNTALCPYCEIDSVLGDDAKDFELNEEFLKMMHDYWFKGDKSWKLYKKENKDEF